MLGQVQKKRAEGLVNRLSPPHLETPRRLNIVRDYKNGFATSFTGWKNLYQAPTEKHCNDKGRGQQPLADHTQSKRRRTGQTG